MFWLLLPALLFAKSVSAQTVESIVRTDTLEIGEVITYSLMVKKDREYDAILLPDSAEFAPEFEVRRRQMFRPGPFADSVVYDLQFFGTKDGFVPNVPVGFVAAGDTSYVLAEKAPFYFKSAITSEEEPAFKPLKPIFAFAMAWWPILLGILVATLLGVAGYRYYQKRKAMAASKPPETIPFEKFNHPIERLERTLSSLKHSDELASGDYKWFYTGLGDAFRGYFEQVYRFPALEQTTGEVIRDLRKHAADVRLIDLANRVLRAADMVKFAKFEPTLDLAHQHFSLATELVTVLKEVDGPALLRMQREFEAAQLPGGNGEKL